MRLMIMEIFTIKL